MVEGVSTLEVEKQASEEMGQTMPPRAHPRDLLSPTGPHTLKNLKIPKMLLAADQQAFYLFEPVEDMLYRYLHSYRIRLIGSGRDGLRENN